MNLASEQADGTSPAPSSAEVVLVVEDSDEDFVALDRAIRRARPSLVLQRASGGRQATAYLNTPDVPRPRLVLLDLNMPDGDGRELLAWIRAHPALAGLPVVVLTTSTSPADVEECYAAGADGYVFKPVNYALFQSAVLGTLDYWVPRR